MLLHTSATIGMTCCLLVAASLPAQSLDDQLKSVDSAQLAAQAREHGDAKRGAIVFYQPYMNCRTCHDQQGQLGPDLSTWDEKPSDADLVDAVLRPSKSIRKGYATVSVQTSDGRVLTGLELENSPDRVVLRELTGAQRKFTLATDDIEARATSDQSLMPTGLASQLSGRQPFLDLIRYLIEIRDGGQMAVRNLEPAPHLYAARPIPEYEQHIDHTGFLREMRDESTSAASFKRGEAIYQRVCANCHGTHDKPGSLPTSLRFASGTFKNASDPHAMYQTLTRGFGMMQPQSWMVPQQKYDVIHYIREDYLRTHNPSQYSQITDQYLSGLPTGDSRGPEPAPLSPWIAMNYGHSLINTYEVGSDGSNFAHKGIAVRLDSGAGGVSRGRQWMVFDHDTMRMAAAWQGDGFINWDGIHFNGRHGVHPRIAGQVLVANDTAPGWANPQNGSFEDTRVEGRDGRRYGPLPKSWAEYHGLYRHGERRIISYRVGEAEILEMPDSVGNTQPVFARHFRVSPHKQELVLRVTNLPGSPPNEWTMESVGESGSRVILKNAAEQAAETADNLQFDGSTFAEVEAGDALDMTSSDFSIAARFRTQQGGVLLAKTDSGERWVPDSKALFVRGGKLCYDIGWVGVVQSRKRVDDGKWHDVVLTWDHDSALATLWIDGKRDSQRELRPEKKANGHVVRIGYANSNFPTPSHFRGDIESIQFHATMLSAEELSAEGTGRPAARPVATAEWKIAEIVDGRIVDQSAGTHAAQIVRGKPSKSIATCIVAGLGQPVDGLKFAKQDNSLRLVLSPSTEPRRFTLWFTALDSRSAADELLRTFTVDETPDLNEYVRGGPARWTEMIETQVQKGNDDGPFATDLLVHPEPNPWNARFRASGFDFFEDAQSAAVCTWDGDVWHLSGLNSPDGVLRWKRMATGLFQPLGLKILEGQIYVTCRDQIVILRDLNGDTETDFYECFNNDHQVTEHFHEFAMGLQADDQGNLYYAKSARHALPAVVPHHGTLLRVSADGSRTDIVATGFRAANGVCLNPDGTFVVTDQEGHWNPKNRINWVQEGGFYGNMFGYHDVTDSSDSAMEPPLAWITNDFDRSPAELLWVPKDAWGPLGGQLLNLSYGYGKVFVVPFEKIDGQVQGGMCELPMPQVSTGLTRGRFHPTDGQLYACGMFAWAGNQQQPGGFYRFRQTGKPMHLPRGLKASQEGVQIEWTDQVDPASATDPNSYVVTAWDLKRSKNYGSKHLNERTWKVVSAQVSTDGKTVSLKIPEIEPTWGMEIRAFLKSTDGQPFRRTIHNSIHRLGPATSVNE